MRILYIFNALNFSGAELMYVQAAKTLQKNGYQLYALITNASDGNFRDQFEKSGFSIRKIPCNNGIWDKIVFYKKLKRLIRQENIDVVHIQRNYLFFVAALAAKSCGIRSVYSVNNIFPSHWYSYWYHFLQRFIARRFLCCQFHTGSDTVYRYERDYYHNMGTIVYWWYKEEDYYPATEEEKHAARKELDIAPHSFVITTAGSCCYQKHHEDIYEALKQVKDDIPEILFMHLGAGVQEEKERDLSRQLGVESHVRFCGNQSDFRKYLIVSDIYVMTSRFEGLSNATVDALACHIPAILYDVTGLRDFNISGENVKLIPESPQCLAEVIKRLYNDRQEMNTLADKGYELVTHKYGSRYCIDNLMKTFYNTARQ